MISIVIPIKLEENQYWDLLPNAIKSVLRQTYTDYELIISQYKNDVSEGRNKGIEKCNGEWILTLDADDILHNTFLEETIKLSDKYDIISTHSNNLLANPDEDFTQANRILNCSLFKKEVWLKNKFDETLYGYEDWKFWLDAKKEGFKFGLVNKQLVYINDTPNSRNKNAIKRHNELVKIIL